METTIKIGITGKQEKIVEAKDTASAYGSGLAEVFATPAMIALMEQTAYKSLEPHLLEGFGTVGISIDVQHKKATLPGKKVQCQSTVTKVDGKRITFEINALDEQGEIGTATHVRYIINNADFIARLK